MNIKDLLMLSMVKNIGPAFIKKNRSVLQNVESCEIFLSEYKTDELESLSLYQNKAEEILDTCEKHSIKIISILEDTYPKRLFEISDPPSILFYKGNETLLNNTIAIIGTRKSTELGNKIAEKVGIFFSEKFSICNGLVEGIDEHAIYHNGRIAKNVVGIISGGLCYKETCSANHIKVIDDVLDANGLIISEFFPKQKEDKYSGSKASRIQAGLSKGLILVQSKVDGGSKYTLEKFVKLGRPLGVIHFPSSEEYNTDVFGANRLIVEEGVNGIAQILCLKKTNTINLKKILALTSKSDYEMLINEIEYKSYQLF